MGGRFAPRRADSFVDAIRDALRAFLRFAGASHLESAPHLATEKRLFLAARDQDECVVSSTTPS